MELGKQSLEPSSTAALDAQLLLGHVLDRRREWVLAHGDAGVPSKELQVFFELVRRRAAGEPVAYLRGWIEWYGLRFAVSRSVLVPRPETEILLEGSIQLAERTGARVAVDVGTGSGVLAVGLAASLPHMRVVAVDIQSEAVAVASENVAAHGLGDRVRVLQGNLLEPVPEPPDLVVANLPYLSDEMMTTLGSDVRHEPETALRAGPLGLDLYEALTEQMAARRWRAPLALETDPRQVTAILELLARQLGGGQTSVVPDLAGRERVVVWEP